MMKKVLFALFTVLYSAVHYGQSAVTELFQKKDYSKLIAFENQEAQLNEEELYMMGYAFYQLEKDEKAIAFYDKAIAKGFDNGIIHHAKAVSLTYLKKYAEAVKEIDKALKFEPNNQEYMNQKGLIYKANGLEDKAFDYFEEATRYPNTIGEPFFWVAYIHHGKQDLEKALRGYYLATLNIPTSSIYYFKSLLSIGQLEYAYTQNYKKAINAYAEALALRPKEYKWYPKLIKAYNADKQYAKAATTFKTLQTAYEQKELTPEEFKDIWIAIDEFEWNKQQLTVYQSLENPKKVLDISYKVFLLNQKLKTPDRLFTVQKTIQTQGGTRHLLCEDKNEANLTYPYGWKTDVIALEDLKKAVVMILDGSLKPTATSK